MQEFLLEHCQIDYQSLLNIQFFCKIIKVFSPSESLIALCFGFVMFTSCWLVAWLPVSCCCYSLCTQYTHASGLLLAACCFALSHTMASRKFHAQNPSFLKSYNCSYTFLLLYSTSLLCSLVSKVIF